MEPTEGGTSQSLLTVPGQNRCKGGLTQLRGQPCCPLSCLVHGERSVLGPRKDWIARTRPTLPQERPDPRASFSAGCLLSPVCSRTLPQLLRSTRGPRPLQSRPRNPPPPLRAPPPAPSQLLLPRWSLAQSACACDHAPAAPSGPAP